MIAGGGGWAWARTPSGCASCHEIRPEYQTWRVGTHQKVSCVSCHLGPAGKGATAGFWRRQAIGLKRVYQHFTRTYNLPIELQAEIPAQRCLSCHSLNRKPTPHTDLKIPHDKHQEQNIKCAACHPGVVHGQIAEREETIDGEFARWTPALARAQLAIRFTAMAMTQCMDCHRERGVSNACDNCHVRIVRPKSHSPAAAWVDRGQHGRDALTDVQGCDRCHSFTKSLAAATGPTPTATYARGNDLCVKCHERKPPGHDAQWRTTHRDAVARDGGGRPEIAPCLTCHNDTPQRKFQKGSKVACSQCHTGIHRKNFKLTHQVPLAERQSIEPRCLTCHSREACAKCHAVSR